MKNFIQMNRLVESLVLPSYSFIGKKDGPSGQRRKIIGTLFQLVYLSVLPVGFTENVGFFFLAIGKAITEGWSFYIF